MFRGVRMLAIGLLVAVSAGCIGATSRDAFNEEVRERGGGLSVELVTGSLDVVAAELGAGSWTDLSVLSVRVRPGDRSVTVVVRQPQRPDFVDTVSVRDGEIVASQPIQDAADLPLDELDIELGGVPLDRIEEIAVEALRAFGESGGFVESVEVTRDGADVRISIDVESDRRTATVEFDGSGTLEGVE